MVETRRRRGTERGQTAEKEQGETLCFRDEEQAEETRVESTDEQDAMSSVEEVTTARGRWTDESSGRSKGKGKGGQEKYEEDFEAKEQCRM